MEDEQMCVYMCVCVCARARARECQHMQLEAQRITVKQIKTQAEAKNNSEANQNRVVWLMNNSEANQNRLVWLMINSETDLHKEERGGGSARYGYRPRTASTPTIPRDHTSLLKEYSSPLIRSGDMYVTVPTHDAHCISRLLRGRLQRERERERERERGREGEMGRVRREREEGEREI
jgi:hypothetical protein